MRNPSAMASYSHSALEKVLQQRFKFTVNPREAETEEVQSPQCGFWLPHGIKIRDFWETWSARYLSVKAAYEVVVGGTWPDDSILEGVVARLLEMERTLCGFLLASLDSLSCTSWASVSLATQQLRPSAKPICKIVPPQLDKRAQC